MIVRELITRLGFSVNQSQLDKADKSTAKIKDSAERAAVAFRNILAGFAGLAAIKSLVVVGDEMQSLRARLALLPQTVGDVGDSFDTVAARATASRTAIDAYTTLYTRVGHAAKKYIATQEELLIVTDAVSQGLVVGGASAQEASSVMLQLSQALGSGTLQGEEFRAMAEGAPQLLDKLALAMGYPREQLKKLASEAKITTQSLIEALKKVGPEIRKEFSSIPLTVGQATTIVANRFKLMIDRMNRETGFITKIADKIILAFDKIEDGIYKLVKAFGGWENAMRLIGIAIVTAFGAKAISLLIEFRTVAWTAALPFIKIAAAITLITLLVEDLYVWINGGDSLIGKFAGEWENWRVIVMGAIEAVIAVFEWFGKLIGAIAAAIVGAFTLDWNLFSEGLKGIGALLWQVVGQWGQWIYDAFFAPIVNAVTDAIDVVKGIIKNIWSGAKDMASAGLNAASNIAAGAATGLSQVGMVSPSQMALSSMGVRPNINNSTQVNVTVPPGTTAEQAKFLQAAADKSFSQASDSKLARDISVYAP